MKSSQFALHNKITSLCKDYYSEHDNCKRFLDALNDRVISIRLLEYFVTHYYGLNSEESYPWMKIPTCPNLPSNSYTTCLYTYSKRNFDPCCRHDRVYLPIEENKCMVTTIAQLNFFRWFFLCHIDQYFLSHYIEISTARKQHLSGKTSYRKRGSVNSTGPRISVVVQQEGTTRNKKRKTNNSSSVQIDIVTEIKQRNHHQQMWKSLLK